MPSTLGLWNARSESESQRESTWLQPDVLEFGVEGLTLPRDVLARSGLDGDEELLVELTCDGLRLTADRFRKVYVEATKKGQMSWECCVEGK